MKELRERGQEQPDEKVVDIARTAPPQKKRKRAGPVRLTLYILFSLLVITGVVAFVAYRDELNADTFTELISRVGLLFGGDGGEASDTFSYDDYMLSRYAAFEGGLALLSETRMVIYGPSGQQRYAADCHMQRPALCVSGHTALAYDRDGNTLLLVNGNATLYETQWPDVLYTACMNARGEFAVVSGARGYASVVTLFNTRREEVYQWGSASLMVLDAALSSSAKQIAVVSAGQQGDLFMGRLTLLDTGRDDEWLTVDLPDELPLRVFYLDDDLLCVVTGRALYFYNAAGEAAGSYAYGSRKLLNFSAGDGFVVLCLGRERDETWAELVSAEADGPRASRLLDGTPRGLSAGGRYAGVLSGGTASVYDADLEPVGEEAEAGDALDILMRADGTALLLAQDGARVFRP